MHYHMLSKEGVAMPDIRIVAESELRAAVGLDLDAVDCIEEGFRLLATKAVEMPPVLSFRIAEYNGEIDVKTAYVPGIDSFAVKISPGFFDNPRLGLPSLNGLMVLFAARTGLVEALLLDNGYLTDVRTAAAGAVAARHLSREDSRAAGIVGCGAQARLQLKALTLVRPIETALVWGRDRARAEACAQECAAELGIEAAAAGSVAEVAERSDVVVTATPSEEPLVFAEMLRPGLHVTAMGSDAGYKCELAPGVVAAAALFACDRRAQSAARGELRAAIAAGAVQSERPFPELGEIVAGASPGRASAEDVTVCDLTGTGVQDTAIAALAYARAQASAAGLVVGS